MHELNFVFYDYDELCFLTDCNFRNLPQATTYEEEISAEPWFSVRETATRGREMCRYNFVFNRTWQGKRYSIKQVAPVIKEEANEIVVMTVYTFYF